MVSHVLYQGEGELSAEGDFLASGDVLFKIHFAVLEYIISIL